MILVDLRSDTISKPSKSMRKAMSLAEVGDDVFGEDPTVKSNISIMLKKIFFPFLRRKIFFFGKTLLYNIII